MEDLKTLGDKIAYQEQMNVTYGDLLYKEERYLQTMQREKTKNLKGFRTFLIFDIICALVMTGGLSAGTFFETNTKDPAAAFVGSVGNAMLTVVGLIIAAFAFVGLCFGGFKLVHYGRRRFKEIDNRDFVWRTYEEMEAISGAKMMELETKKAQNLAELSVNRQVYQEGMEGYAERIEEMGEESEGEMEHISMSELFYAKETARPQLPENEDRNKNALKKTW